jgi:sulfur carrier protein ThiS
MITVKVGKFPGQVSEYNLNDDCTVACALSQASLSSEGYSILVNGIAGSLDDTLDDGDRVILSEKVEGGNA